MILDVKCGINVSKHVGATLFEYLKRLGRDVVTCLGRDVVTRLGRDVVTRLGREGVTRLGRDVVTRLGQDVVTRLFNVVNDNGSNMTSVVTRLL